MSLNGSLAEDVAKPKADGDGKIVVLGSGELVAQLIAHGATDEYRLCMHPLALGTGKRLFHRSGEAASSRGLCPQRRTCSCSATPLPDAGVGRAAVR
jgi:dihydrofolate reductase